MGATVDVRLEDGSTATTTLDPVAGAVTSVTGTPPITSSGGSTPAIGITLATDSAAGSMSAADKTKLDGLTAGVTAVTGTAPITSSGGDTPAIGITLATDGAAGSMSAADKTKLDGISAGATPSVLTSTAYAQAAVAAVPNTGVFTSIIGGNLAVTIPVGGASVVLIGSATGAESTTTAGAGAIVVFVDGVESGGFATALPLGVAGSLTTSGSASVTFKTAPLAAGAHTVDLRVSSGVVAATANGMLTALVVTA